MANLGEPGPPPTRRPGASSPDQAPAHGPDQAPAHGPDQAPAHGPDRTSAHGPDQAPAHGPDRASERDPDQASDDAGGSGQRRAGRNLPAAFAVGGGLAVVLLAVLLLWRPAFLAVIVVAAGVGIWEMTRTVRVTGAHPPLVPLLAGGAAMVVVAWFWGPEALSLSLLATVFAVLVWRLGDGPGGYQQDVSAATLIAVYVPFLAGFAALLAASDDGHWRVLLMLAVVVLTDTGGYVAGVFFGRHLLAPSVSPKKTWEGLAGSLLAAAAGGAVGLPLLFGVAWWWGIGFGLVIAGAAVLGDLAESLLKRDLGVKDMSGLLPGHGGLMDRLDSILFALPPAYLLLSVLVG